MVQDLTPKPELKTVTAHDLKGNYYQVSTDSLKLRVSAYGLLVNDHGDFLVQRHPSTTLFGLPGGGLDIGETVSEALIREFVEETGLNIQIETLLSVKDDYFTNEGVSCQSVLVFYQVSLLGGWLIYSNGQDVAETKFMSLSEAKESIFLPKHFSVIKDHLCR